MTKLSQTDTVVERLPTWEQYLHDGAVPRELIDTFLQRPGWAQFDPELGYILHNSFVPWGLDGTATFETFHRNGARSGFLYVDRTPRINSYGDSFTECTQVSDGETWQEYLAGHFGEPVGNYGVGGYGVYQAYRRMLREEQDASGTELLLLYIWGDDPLRSLLRSFWVSRYRWYDTVTIKLILFHGNPWPHIEMDLSSGLWVERENPLPTCESLYKMCDPEWIVEHHRDDVAMQLYAYCGVSSYGLPGRISALDRKLVTRLADTLEFHFDWGSHADCMSQARSLLGIYGQRATNYILDKAKAFARRSNKRLLVVLNFTARSDSFSDPVIPSDGTRQDQEILAHLNKEGFDYFDMNSVHQREYEKTSGSYSEYMSQYIVNGGHYNPRGNHLFAYSIKDKLVEMLDPKPLPYRDLKGVGIDFKGYLPNA